LEIKRRREKIQKKGGWGERRGDEKNRISSLFSRFGYRNEGRKKGEL